MHMCVCVKAWAHQNRIRKDQRGKSITLFIKAHLSILKRNQHEHISNEIDIVEYHRKMLFISPTKKNTSFIKIPRVVPLCNEI